MFLMITIKLSSQVMLLRIIIFFPSSRYMDKQEHIHNKARPYILSLYTAYTVQRSLKYRSTSPGKNKRLIIRLKCVNSFLTWDMDKKSFWGRRTKTKCMKNTWGRNLSEIKRDERKKGWKLIRIMEKRSFEFNVERSKRMGKTLK